MAAAVGVLLRRSARTALRPSRAAPSCRSRCLNTKVFTDEVSQQRRIP